MKDQQLTFGVVLSHLRKRDFAVLSTVSSRSRPHSVGVNYGVSAPGRDLAIYVMTRTHLLKARNIAQNPSVSLVVPLTRRVLGFLPPPAIQLYGQAEIRDWTDEEGTAVFRGFWLGRRILEAYHEAHRRGETRICFVRITPDPVVYGGVSSRVEKEKWRILPVGEVHDQPAALPGGHRRNAPWGKVSGSRPLRLTSSGSR